MGTGIISSNIFTGMFTYRKNPHSIPLEAACELFLRYSTRTSAMENEDFNVTKARLIERGNQFADTSTRARASIADVGSRFITNNATILCHGHSRVVSTILQRAAAQGAHFNVVATECRLEEAGLKWAKELAPRGIPVSIILDSAAAYHMDRFAHASVMPLPRVPTFPPPSIFDISETMLVHVLYFGNVYVDH
jgi:translation initiation factor 2B subunit (eIF-2B alpha/beta/delta family)